MYEYLLSDEINEHFDIYTLLDLHKKLFSKAPSLKIVGIFETIMYIYQTLVSIYQIGEAFGKKSKN